MISFGIFLCLLWLTNAATFSGTISSVNDVALPAPAPLVVQAIRHRLINGVIQELTVAEYYAATPIAQVEADAHTGAFKLELQPGLVVAIFAFVDATQSGRYDPLALDAIGWYSGPTQNWVRPLWTNTSITGLNFPLFGAKTLPDAPAQCAGGKLHLVHDLHVLSLWGDAAQRGWAHGFLLGPNIVQFFRRFTFEYFTSSAQSYQDDIIPYLLNNYNLAPEYIQELESILLGIRASNTSLFVPELGRDLQLVDLLWLNDYGNYLATPTNAGTSRKYMHRCSQFVFWGSATTGSDVAGGTITGRNMDGENDIRKLSVTNLVVFAVAPSNSLRYVSVFWPGMVVTASGFNEKGIYIMGNDGTNSAQPPLHATNITSDGWVQRQVLATARSTADAMRVVASFRNSLGGICATGCNLVIAQPVQQDSPLDTALVLESDRFGSAFRRAGDSYSPLMTDGILATNHYLKYGFDPSAPLENFGVEVEFTSLWRYAAGAAAADALTQSSQPIGTDTVRRLLQNVAHGSTEHSIIFRPAELTFDLAIADVRALPWNAPYAAFTTFTFAELF